MALTVQNIIDRAALRSNLNDATLVSSSGLITHIDLFQKRIFLTAARVNPDYFGVEGSTSVRASGATWSLAASPSASGIAAVSLATVITVVGAVPLAPVGTTVNIVSLRNPNAGIAPRVYLRNKTISEYGGELSVDGSNYVSALKLWYSPLPTQLTAVSDSVSVPDEFNDLLILPVARLLAIRDQRPDEAAALDQEFAIGWSTFIAALSVYDEGTIRELDRTEASYHKIGE